MTAVTVLSIGPMEKDADLRDYPGSHAAGEMCHKSSKASLVVTKSCLVSQSQELWAIRWYHRAELQLGDCSAVVKHLNDELRNCACMHHLEVAL